VSSRRSGSWLLGALLLAAPPAAAELRLREVARDWGLAFRHHHGGSGRRYIAETMVGGVAILDYDGDGDGDVLFVDGGALPGYRGETPRSRLYRNEGGGRFVDVSDAAGIASAVYGSGAAVGDVDGDGAPDLLLTALGPDRLLRNRGDGTFEDATLAAGLGDPGWSTSAAFADVDRDGDLDLYAAHYVEFTPEGHRPCENLGIEVYCHPGAYAGSPDRFYRNRGDGTFEEDTAGAGLAVPVPMAGLGVAFGDLDLDGWPDLFVANDADPNFLFLNRGDGTFEEEALLAGVAYGIAGRPEAGMGVDLGDVDGDGLPDVVVTNFELETNALYRNTGQRVFIDDRFKAQIAEPSLLDLAFGVTLADLDQDGDLDLAVANGHILDNAARFHERSRYAQANVVLENLGDGRFRPAPDAGLGGVVRASRGLASGDLDGDGDLDLAIVNSDDVAEVWENLGAAGGWLLVDLAGRGGNRFGVGARLELAGDGRRQVREARTASSYLSQGAATVHFGLGPARAADLEVIWPTGARQRFTGLPAARRLRVVERP